MLKIEFVKLKNGIRLVVDGKLQKRGLEYFIPVLNRRLTQYDELLKDRNAIDVLLAQEKANNMELIARLQAVENPK